MKVQGSVANRAVEGVKTEKVSFLFWPLSICLGVNFPVNSTPPGHLSALSWGQTLRDPRDLPAEHAYARAHAQPTACGSPPVLHLGEPSAGLAIM